MLKPAILFAILGLVALLIAALATFFVLNISSLTLAKTGMLIGIAVAVLLVVLAVIFVIARGIFSRK